MNLKLKNTQKTWKSLANSLFLLKMTTFFYSQLEISDVIYLTTQEP